jgi:hypothetical protein
MSPERTTVFLPCHTLDDFPTWLEETEAGDLLAAWTAAWHPQLVAAVGSPPGWASIDLPVPAGPLLGIVPASWDDRFAAQFDATCTVGSAFVRRTAGAAAIERAAAERLGLPAESPAGARWADDFRALGLAALLAELLARRMRTRADLESTGFSAAVVAAARAAVAGRDDDASAALHEAFDALSATRARYYPVDSYVVDLVLVAASTPPAAFATAVDAPVPVAFAATGEAMLAVAAGDPEAVAAIRAAVAAGRVEPCGGAADDAPLDLSTPEAVRAAWLRCRQIFLDVIGAPPASFARVSGGGATILPQLLAGFGIEGGVWTRFDGGLLPDVGGGMIRWTAAGGAIDLLASAPLDARSARTVLALPDALGDTLDRNHVAALLFAHHAGTASPWHRLVRRIGRWSNLLGTFVTPRELARRAAGAGTPVALEPDAFPPTLPRGAEADAGDPVSAAVARAAREADAIVAAAAPFMACAPPPTGAPPAPLPPSRRRWLSFGIPAGSGGDADRLALDNGFVRVEVHPQTGGLLAVRRDRDGGNRLSQQLAIRGPARGGEEAIWTRMVADAVERVAAEDGDDAIASRGRLVARDGGVAARFSQRVALVEGRPLAVVGVRIDLERPLVGPLLDDHVAARFAWHENEHMEIRRSLLTQAVVTERTRFTAPHFIQIVPEGPRVDATADAVTILTGGLPWHLLSTPHVLDSVLGNAAGGGVSRRFAVGLGLSRPWDAALALAAGASFHAAIPGLPEHVRLTVADVTQDAGRVIAARVGLVESAGRAGEVDVDWGRPVARATAVDFIGGRQAEPAVAIEGSRTVVSLERYQWLQLDLGFAG